MAASKATTTAPTGPCAFSSGSCARRESCRPDRPVVVNGLDLIELVMTFGPCEGCPADLDDDGYP